MLVPLLVLLGEPPSLHARHNYRRPRHMPSMCRLFLHNSKRRSSILAAEIQNDTNIWIPAPLSVIKPAAESLFHITIDVSSSPDILASYTRAGQYLLLRLSHGRPSLFSIASPPLVSALSGGLEFLVKRVAGSTAGALCELRKGDMVELSRIMGTGFDVDRIDPPEMYPTVLMFATGSGISASQLEDMLTEHEECISLSPIRSLIESGFGANKRSDVRLYYGARSLNRMAYVDRFREWESSGMKIISVLSRPDGSWIGKSGYVQDAFTSSKKICNPIMTAAVLCGQKQMTEEVTSILIASGISGERILKNL